MQKSINVFSAFLFLVIFSLSFTACNKEETPSAEISEFKFSKQLTVEDKDGNSALVEVSTNNEERLALFTASSLKLFTYTERPSVPNASPSTPSTDQEAVEINRDIDNVVFIDIKEFQLNENIVLFRVDLATELEVAFDQATERYGIPSFEFGANGVLGAFGTYTAENCNNNGRARMQYDLDKKTATSNLFWQGLENGRMYNVGDTFDYCGSTLWNSYRIRFDGERCAGSQEVVWGWATNC